MKHCHCRYRLDLHIPSRMSSRSIPINRHKRKYSHRNMSLSRSPRKSRKLPVWRHSEGLVFVDKECTEPAYRVRATCARFFVDCYKSIHFSYGWLTSHLFWQAITLPYGRKLRNVGAHAKKMYSCWSPEHNTRTVERDLRASVVKWQEIFDSEKNPDWRARCGEWDPRIHHSRFKQAWASYFSSSVLPCIADPSPTRSSDSELSEEEEPIPELTELSLCRSVTEALLPVEGKDEDNDNDEEQNFSLSYDEDGNIIL